MIDRRPLVVGTEGVLLDEILRLAAAVGCDVDCVGDLVAARSRWTRAPLVLLDEDAARAGSVDLPRRSEVLFVCKGAPPLELWQSAFAMGAGKVLTLPDEEDALLAALADAAEGPSGERGHVIAVVGARGGAGASVVAASVGLGVSRAGGTALLVDCDPLGGGVDSVVGAENSTGLRWPDLRVRSGRVAMSELEAALPYRKHGKGRLYLMSCDRDGPGPTADAVAAVVEAGRRAGRVVVCDLPRRLDDGAGEAARRADLIVLVVPAEFRACVAAKRVLAQIGELRDRVQVLARGPAPDGLTAEDVVDAVGAPLLAWLPRQRGLARAVERGMFNPKPGRPLGTASKAVLKALVRE